MRLPEELDERLKLTKSYPVLVTSLPGGGKSSMAEFLSDEDKARTVIINYDNKALPEDDEDLYFKVKRLNDPSDKNPTTASESLDSVRKSIASPKVDRVIVDTFSGYFRAIDAESNKKYSGFDVWKNYNKKIDEMLQMLKTETAAHGKFVYVLAHYKPIKKDLGEKKTVAVKGNEWFALVEGEFNTVLEAIVEGGQFRLEADNGDEFTSTRIKRTLSPFVTETNSMDELEHKLTGTEFTQPE